MRIVDVIDLIILLVILVILILFILIGLWIYDKVLIYLDKWYELVDEFNIKKNEFTDSFKNIEQSIDELKIEIENLKSQNNL